MQKHNTHPKEHKKNLMALLARHISLTRRRSFRLLYPLVSPFLLLSNSISIETALSGVELLLCDNKIIWRESERMKFNCFCCINSFSFLPSMGETIVKDDLRESYLMQSHKKLK
jgi:hypothetical protein